MKLEERIRSFGSKTCRVGLAAAAMLISAANYVKAQANQWVAEMTLTAQDGSGNYSSDSVNFGTTNGATRGYDSGLERKKTDMPPGPGGNVSLFMEISNGVPVEGLQESYISPTNQNRSYRGAVVQTGSKSTNVKFSSLPNQFVWDLLTFSDYAENGGKTNGAARITNGQDISFPTNDFVPFIITPAIDLTNVQASTSGTSTYFKVSAKYDCCDALTRIIAEATDSLRGTWSPLGFMNGTGGCYNAEFLLPARQKYVRARP
jgi:hypothetical protein